MEKCFSVTLDFIVVTSCLATLLVKFLYKECMALCLIVMMFLLYSLLLFLLWFVFGDPASGGQRDVDVQDSHDNDWKIESCYSSPKRHCGVRKKL